MRKLIYGICGVFLAAAMMGNTSCSETPTARDANVTVQKTLMSRANAAVPVPQVNNFLAREAVAKQVKRLDEKGKLFYVYVVTITGQTMGYYVSNTRPVATCSLLTPPDDLWKDYNGGGNMSQLMTAPGLGGTYPGGACTTSFFFDAATDAYIEVPTSMILVTDQPLSLKAEAITVKNAQ